MRYGVQSTPLTRDTYRLISGDDVTYAAWKIEGRYREYGLRWRELCADNGIVDPMQAATPQGERFLLGERLRMGRDLKV